MKEKANYPKNNNTNKKKIELFLAFRRKAKICYWLQVEMKKGLSIFKEQLTWWLFSADSPPLLRLCQSYCLLICHAWILLHAQSRFTFLANYLRGTERSLFRSTHMCCCIVHNIRSQALPPQIRYSKFYHVLHVYFLIHQWSMCKKPIVNLSTSREAAGHA